MPLKYCFVIVLGVLLCSVSSWAQETNVDNVNETLFLQLWNSELTFPKKNEVSFPKDVEHYVVQDGNQDPNYQFMHETALGFLGNELFYGWYNNVEKELEGLTIQRFRRSSDLGRTWTASECFPNADHESGAMYVGLQFFSVGTTLYALTNLERGAERPVDCLLLRYEEKNEGQKWEYVAPIASRFLSMQAPVLMENGNYVVSGSYALEPGQKFASTPAVYISDGTDIAKPWRLVRLDPNVNVNVFAETSIVVDGSHILATTRRDDALFPNFYASDDFGETWRPVENKVFPSVSSKFASGKFSNGIRYIVFNFPDFERTAEGKIDVSTLKCVTRDTLAIAIAKPGEKAFSKIFKVSDPLTSIQVALSHYPCVAEHDGWIYISYTAAFKDKPLRIGALTKFPLKSLE